MCALPDVRAAIAAALPDLEVLDGRPLAAERQQGGPHMARLQLQAFQLQV